MAAMIVSVFLASVLGSLHCAGMCGAFLALAVSPTPGVAMPPRAQVQAAYHLGRLTTYLLLGALAGSAGALVNLGSKLAGIQPVAASLAGGVMIWFGVSMLLRLAGVRVPRMPLPALLQTLLMAGHSRAMALAPTLRAGTIGLLTTLLPCGWLYAFAVVAAGTASPWKGPLVMLVFWAGTLPVLVALGSGLQHGLGTIGRRLPVITSMAVIIVGLYTIAGRFSLDPKRLAASVSATTQPTRAEAACCDTATAGEP